jgi:hypothetical protein
MTIICAHIIVDAFLSHRRIQPLLDKLYCMLLTLF